MCKIFNLRTMVQDEFKTLNHCIAPLLLIYFYVGSRVGKETFRFYTEDKQQTHDGKIIASAKKVLDHCAALS